MRVQSYYLFISNIDYALPLSHGFQSGSQKEIKKQRNPETKLTATAEIEGNMKMKAKHQVKIHLNQQQGKYTHNPI